MESQFYGMPPLTTLIAFEAAARHRSFKNAAQDLNVTPGAVSHQIKALETTLGVRLFERRHRGVELTGHGEMLFRELERSFSRTAAVLERIRRDDPGHAVIVSATSAVSALWLTPRLSRFWRQNGQIAINQHVSDFPDAGGHSADLQIRYGDFDSAGKCQNPLFLDHLVPLCTPQFAANNQNPDLSALAAMPLIHLDAPDSNWTTWRTWFEAQGYDGPIAHGTRVNNYSIALQCAQDEVGVVLGWRDLAAPLIHQCVLVTLGDQLIAAPAPFVLVSQPEASLSESAIILRDWLLQSV